MSSPTKSYANAAGSHSSVSAHSNILKSYQAILKEFPNMSLPIVAVKALSETIQVDTAGTTAELFGNLERHGEILRSSCKNPIAVRAGCDHFTRIATRTPFDGSFEAYKLKIIESAEAFISKSLEKREALAEYGIRFITDDAIILVHSYSRVVMLMLLKAAANNIRFQVLVTESRPSSSGARAVKELKDAGIPAVLILDAAVGYFMGRVNMVLVGAEGIAENGGLINQMGTYQIAVVAKAANKPFYVVTETHKFVRIFPLDQYNLTPTSPHSKLVAPQLKLQKSKQNLKVDGLDGFNEISFDYTPPAYISLMFTDLGVLTPSGAADELIKFFN